MNIQDATCRVVDALDSAGILYMLAGSLSSMYYSVSRSTTDADFVVDVSSVSIGHVVKHLGPEFRFDPQMSFETVTGTSRNIIDVTGTPFKIELFRLSVDEHDQERFSRRRLVRMFEKEVFIPTAEDVVITKLRWLRIKDRADIQQLLAVQGDKLDWNYIHRWCDLHETREAFDEIRSQIPVDLSPPSDD